MWRWYKIDWNLGNSKISNKTGCLSNWGFQLLLYTVTLAFDVPDLKETALSFLLIFLGIFLDHGFLFSLLELLEFLLFLEVFGILASGPFFFGVYFLPNVFFFKSWAMRVNAERSEILMPHPEQAITLSPVPTELFKPKSLSHTDQ